MHLFAETQRSGIGGRLTERIDPAGMFTYRYKLPSSSTCSSVGQTVGKRNAIHCCRYADTGRGMGQVGTARL